MWFGGNLLIFIKNLPLTELVARCSYYAFSLVLGMYFDNPDAEQPSPRGCMDFGLSKSVEKSKISDFEENPLVKLKLLPKGFSSKISTFSKNHKKTNFITKKKSLLFRIFLIINQSPLECSAAFLGRQLPFWGSRSLRSEISSSVKTFTMAPRQLRQGSE